MGFKKFILGVSISAIIGGTALVGFLEYQDQQRIKQYRQEEKQRNIASTKRRLKNWQRAIETYSKFKRDYPNRLTDIIKEINSKANQWEEFFELRHRGTPQKDSWDNELNYIKTTFKELIRNKYNKLEITENSHYELFSNGPDGIQDTRDDIQAWYISNHEWGSTKKLNEKFKYELKEARKSSLDKTIEKGRDILEGVEERIFRRLIR